MFLKEGGKSIDGKLTVTIVDIIFFCLSSLVLAYFLNIESCLLAPSEFSDHIFNVVGDSGLARKVM